MLQEISIKNFAIIEEISLSFESGMTILTGETGAGKSIIIDAMLLLLGGRASSDFVRHGAKKAEIEGLFQIPKNEELAEKLESYGIDKTNELILRREITADGKSTSRINGQLVTLAILREISEFLIDIHGQHDNQVLMNPKHHLELLDEFGDADFLAAKADYQQIFEEFIKLRHALTERRKNQVVFAQRIETLTFQLNEIENAAIDLSADENLEQQHEKLVHQKDIAEALHTAFLALDGDEESENSALNALGLAMSRLESIANFDESYQSMSKVASDSYYALEDLAASLENSLDDIEFNPSELAMMEERLGLLVMLKKKYGPELADVLKYLESVKNELSELTGGEADDESLEKHLRSKQKELVKAVELLNAKRHDLAEQLEVDVKQELTDLYMEKADFKVTFTPGKFTRQGNEQVAFDIQTNPGEGFKPLAKTASGGELSRLMLAIKSSFARRENKTAIVFDEVDTGVSGRVAQAIAQKIYKIAQSGQVLAISHLPQVVAIADQQYYIEKSSSENVTTSTVRILTEEERVEEIAKMLAGSHLTEEARAQARHLLSH